jgi:putative colanic acid biosynthesis UDP-glucose lipid carrier transferase
MISHRTRGLLSTLLVCQIVLAVLLLGLVALLTFTWLTGATAEQWSRYPIYAAMVMVGLVLESLARYQSRHLLRRDFLVQHELTLRQTAFAIGAVLAWIALTKDQTISRWFLLIYVPFLYAILLSSNCHLPILLARGIFGGVHEERTLLIGSVEKAKQLKKWLEAKEMFGFRTVGFLTPGAPRTGTLEGFRCAGAYEDLEAVVRCEKVTQVILLELPQDREEHRRLVATVEKLGVRFLILSNLEEMLHHPVVHLEDDGLRFITLREEPLENPLNRIVKRGLDLAVSLPIVLIVLPPLAVLVWIIQRFQSPGPVFYAQTRAGIQNRHFQIFKFRTMTVDNPDVTRAATHDDHRVYPAGRWLRRLSLDELPQFINVLRGEMSVTGPRPHMVEHNALFAEQMANYHIRTLVKPGITGLAQVRGFRGEARSAAEIAKRLESDLSYVENWRLALDVSIILRTAWQMVQPPRTAY